MEASSKSQERKLVMFPVLPGAAQDFVIDKEDYNVVHEILVGSGIKYKLTRVQQMVRLLDPKGRRICKLFMPANNNDVILPLPASIGRLKELTHLVLGKQFSAVASLPDAIGDLENLRYLCLRGSGVTSLPPSFGRLKNLESLDMSYTMNLTITALPDTMGDLIKLRHLNLRGSAVASLPSSFGRLKNLESLNVSYTQNLLVLPQDFGNLTNLKKLDVRVAMILSLPPSIKKCHHLVTIDLSTTDNVLKLIKKVWGNPLSTFDAMCCFIACLPLTEMDEWLSRASHYDCENIGLSFIKTDWPPKQNLSYEQREIGVSAHTLDLSRVIFANRLLPRNICCMANLRDLDLSFTRNFSLPEQIGNLRSLEILNLKGSRIDSLPFSIGRLENLRVLDLTSTYDMQRLPISIGDLRSLEILILRLSRIVSLPLSIGRLQNLRVLDLSSTFCMPRLPMSIAQLHHLKHLDLRSSHISEWPPYMQCLKGLVHLNLRDSWIRDRCFFEFMKMLVGHHPSLESLALVRQPWKMTSERMLHMRYLDQYRYNGAPSDGFRENDRRSFANAKYKMVKTALLQRGINSSRLQSPKLWPRKLKKMTLDFTDRIEAERGYTPDVPIFREADVIYGFLRNTVCHIPNQIWQK